MKKCFLFTMVMCCLAQVIFAQTAPTCYRLTFTDKNNTPYSVDNPTAYLSERAIAKRSRFSIPITEQDFPVNPQYVQQILSMDTNIRILCSCKWFNTVTVYCPNAAVLPQLSTLPFVSDVLPVANYNLEAPLFSLKEDMEETQTPVVFNNFKEEVVPYDYGYGYGQIAIHNGHLLHNEGFRGDGMLIAVIDGGWNGVDTIESFRKVFEEGRMLGTCDLLPWSNNVFEGHHHGTIVTATMAVSEENVLVGTAPQASYFLIRSEEVNQEQLIEEDFWAQAAVIADSIGADVVSSSLGYTAFRDFPEASLTYENMDGVSSIASLAATMLTEKGVVVCVSAGNDGNKEWHYIGHPADAFNILTVGAVGLDSVSAFFSSYGPSYDGRVKPDVASVGMNTYCIAPDNQVTVANGTSFSCPIVAGLCACLWQALPAASVSEIMQFVRESGSCYQNPNDSLGYGIPDFYAAYSCHTAVPTRRVDAIEVFPNPTSDFVHIANSNLQISKVELYTSSGQMIKLFCNPDDYLCTIDVQDMPRGAYVGKVYFQNGTTAFFKIMKL